jgi:NAD(P)-dependent dehydrogenase (short-subunit alcohol dehydrogenase family)
MVQTWAAETKSTNLRVNAFTPGPIRTRMRAQAMPGEDPMTLETPDKVAEKIVEMCLPGFDETGKVYAYLAKRTLAFTPPS